MKENIDKEVVLHYGKRWMGTVQYFVDMPEEEWERLRYEILLEVSEIEIIGADHQYSKLAFTSHIDKLKGIKRGKEA